MRIKVVFSCLTVTAYFPPFDRVKFVDSLLWPRQIPDKTSGKRLTGLADFSLDRLDRQLTSQTQSVLKEYEIMEISKYLSFATKTHIWIITEKCNSKPNDEWFYKKLEQTF